MEGIEDNTDDSSKITRKRLTAIATSLRSFTKDVDMWRHNAWDNMEWTDEMQQAAIEAVMKQKTAPVGAETQQRINGNPARCWDKFYQKVRDRHFQDRSWLFKFPELEKALSGNTSTVITEIGCGPGNTTFPLLSSSDNDELYIHSLDFSKEAIDMVKANPLYDEKKCNAQVWDLASPEGLPPNIKPGSVDVAVMIFVFSALHPDQWEQALKNVWTMLKPNGMVLFRDYGRYDLAQLRFKKNRLLQDNLYMRGDETRVYFFEKEEVSDLFTKYGFNVIALDEDRKLLLNRKRQLKMNRVWIHARFQKTASS